MAMNEINFQHWKSERDEDNIVWLTLDKKNSSTNTLDAEVLEEFMSILQSLESHQQPAPAGIIIQSGKKNGFIAGADISQFKSLDSSETAFHMIRKGQIIFNHLAKLPFPSVALIHGFCVGGGLELALACRYRIAIEDPKTKLGLPEVNLGIHPGWGGTVRLPRLIGIFKAMDLILSGRTVDAKTAYKMGLVDASVPLRQAKRAARYYAQKHPEARKASRLLNLANVKGVRTLLGKWFEKKVSERVNPLHYPAPFAAIHLWVKQGVSDAAFIAEAKSISELMVTDTARNLVRVFFLQEKLKSLGKELHFNPNHVHVVGAGVMGGDIAAWCALKDIHVTLEDQNLEAIANSLKRALTLFQKRLKEPHRVQAARDRLLPDVKGNGIKNADLIIEAIVEKAEVKIELFEKLNKDAKESAIFATNTSTIPLADMSKESQIRKRLIGLHFFNPVAKMPLVEVIESEYSDPLALQKGMAFVRLIDKLPLLVKSSPGFLVNRILMPYLLEGMLLVEAGIPPEAIDKAAVDFGLPMGPIELADAVGLDVCKYSGESLKAHLNDTTGVPAVLNDLFAKGQLGRKTGQGFYRYKNGKTIKKKLINYHPPEDLSDRLILTMLNAAVACWRERIVSEKDYLDAGMIFGSGFPPFRGGPMHYIEEQGEALLLQRLNLLAQRYGDRFVPDPGWKSL